MPSIYPYNMDSESAKALSKELGWKRIKHEGKPLKLDRIINWGASAIDRKIEGAIINKPACVATATDKLLAFRAFKEADVCIPEFTESRDEAVEWLKKGRVVVARTKLRAHSGDGIVIIDPDDDAKEIPVAKLYTRYIPKAEEYRIHVNKKDVFFVQRKARSKDIPDDKVNWKVRNHGNGFIYENQNVAVAGQQEAFKQAKKAIAALGLDFGAVDLVYNRHSGKHYVLEVNTAPGLTGATLQAYTNLFKEFE